MTLTVHRSKAKKIGVVQFKLRWTLQERLKIAELRATDLAIEDFFSLLDDPRLTTIDVSIDAVSDAVAYTLDQLVSAGIVAPEEKTARAAAILQP